MWICMQQSKREKKMLHTCNSMNYITPVNNWKGTKNSKKQWEHKVSTLWSRKFSTNTVNKHEYCNSLTKYVFFWFLLPKPAQTKVFFSIFWSLSTWGEGGMPNQLRPFWCHKKYTWQTPDIHSNKTSFFFATLKLYSMVNKRIQASNKQPFQKMRMCKIFSLWKKNCQICQKHILTNNMLSSESTLHFFTFFSILKANKKINWTMDTFYPMGVTA